ncbi:MAG: hypothetical protein AB1696_00505 [Planctomycetota bacterium]
MKRSIGKALKILIIPILFLVNYPIQKALVGEWQDKFGGEMVYLPYWKSWLVDERTAYLLTGVALQFEKAKGRWPENLQEIKDAELIRQFPPEPAGGCFRFDAKQKRVALDYDKDTDLKRERQEIVFQLLSAVDRFEEKFGRAPADLDEMVERGILDKLPEDPGGCDLCLDPYRKVIGLQYGKFVRRVQFGWNNVVADLLWIRGFHYVQGQWQLIEAGHKKPTEGWHMQLPDLYEVVTDLDPHFIPAYRGGAVLVSALSKRPRQSIHLLEKGVRHNPRTYWELPYELACILLLEVGDEEQALKWLKEASDRDRYPEASPVVLRLRTFLEAKHDRFDTAIRIWEPWLQSDSPVYRQVAEEQISRVLMGIMRKRLADGVRIYKEAKGREMSDEEFAKFAPHVKKMVVDEYGEKAFEEAVKTAMETEFQLWQFARFRLPAGEPLKKTTALGPRRRAALAGLQKAVEEFKRGKGAWPGGLDDLVREKLIDRLPSPVEGEEYYLEIYPRFTAQKKAHEAGEQEGGPQED